MEARFAFVIGNDDYEGAPLKTAANDAGLMAETFRSAGFDITGARNLDQDTLRASFREFVRKVEAAGPSAVTAVYISGYGIQVEGENYLVPPHSQVQRETDVALNAVRLSDLTRALGSLPARGQMVMFDLAYDSPFGKQGQPIAPGLSLMEPDANMLLSFNTAPGMYAPAPQGDYGPYAQSLSEVLRLAGMPVNDVFARVRTRTAELSQGAQLPWNASRLSDQLTLVERAPDAPAAAFDLREIHNARSRPMREFNAEEAYSAALDRDTITAYEEFISLYPDSPFAKNARGILAARREAITWSRTVNANSAQAYWSYLERYPQGPHAGDARRRLARLAAPLQPPPSYSAYAYDVAPPPRDELVYFERPVPVYIETYAAPPPPVYFLPPPPVWYRPPPPPAYEVYDSAYFLPLPAAAPPPPWWSPPAYVVAPPVYERRPGINPYVAIPAALAAGIAAGAIIANRRPSWTQRQGFTPPPQPQPPSGVTTFNSAPTARTAVVPPPTATPPRPMNQIVNQQGLPQTQVQAPVSRVAPSVAPAVSAPSIAPAIAPTGQRPVPNATGDLQKGAPAQGQRLGPQPGQQPGQPSNLPMPGRPPVGSNALPSGSALPNARGLVAPTAPSPTSTQPPTGGARLAPGEVRKPDAAPATPSRPGDRYEPPRTTPPVGRNLNAPAGNVQTPNARPMVSSPTPAPQQRFAPNTAPRYVPPQAAPQQRSAPSVTPSAPARPAYQPPQVQQRPQPQMQPQMQRPQPQPQQQMQRPQPQPQMQRPSPPPQAARPAAPPPQQPKRACGGPNQPKC